MYIYIYRERERHIYIYIYIYSIRCTSKHVIVICNYTIYNECHGPSRGISPAGLGGYCSIV